MTSEEPFGPPDDLRPAQIGLLLHRTVRSRHIVATIADLAVRGYVRISELPEDYRFQPRNWWIHKLKTPGPELIEYEVLVLEALFGEQYHEPGTSLNLARQGGVRSVIDVQDLHGLFFLRLDQVEGAIYADAFGRGWIAHVPTVGGRVARALAALRPRTRVARALTPRIREFERNLRASKPHQLFELVPYAMVFRCEVRWTQALQGIETPVTDFGWYRTASPVDAEWLAKDIAKLAATLSTAVRSGGRQEYKDPRTRSVPS